MTGDGTDPTSGSLFLLKTNTYVNIRFREVQAARVEYYLPLIAARLD